jgi:hypothetical protein
VAVTIHIEHLVLHGFDPRDRHAIGEALRTELTALSTGANALPSRSANIDRLDAGSVAIDSVRSPAAPRAIAGAVHREVTKS